ncbi:hypothetical protein M8494_23635 [Serratia ureilytica]
MTQNTGPLASAMSRMVPPPTAVTTPNTSTPNGSMRNLPASSTPEMANTAVPRISNQNTSISGSPPAGGTAAAPPTGCAARRG